MDCADDAKDTIPPGAKEGDASVERAMAKVKPVPAINSYLIPDFFFFYVKTGRQPPLQGYLSEGLPTARSH